MCGVVLLVHGLERHVLTALLCVADLSGHSLQDTTACDLLLVADRVNLVNFLKFARRGLIV